MAVFGRTRAGVTQAKADKAEIDEPLARYTIGSAAIGLYVIAAGGARRTLQRYPFELEQTGDECRATHRS